MDPSVVWAQVEDLVVGRLGPYAGDYHVEMLVDLLAGQAHGMGGLAHANALADRDFWSLAGAFHRDAWGISARSRW